MDGFANTIDNAIDEWHGRLCAFCASKYWTIWAIVVIITISILPFFWNFIFFYKYDVSFNFIWQFYDKFELPISIYWKFPSLSSDERILKIGWDLTKLPPGQVCLQTLQEINSNCATDRIHCDQLTIVLTGSNTLAWKKLRYNFQSNAIPLGPNAFSRTNKSTNS